VLITPSLGVPNWSVIYIINTVPPRHCQKLIVFCVLGLFFVSLLPTVLGAGLIYKEYDSLYILERNANFCCCFCIYGTFCELLPTVLGLRGDLQGP
jgi:hypothetical protein